MNDLKNDKFYKMSRTKTKIEIFSDMLATIDEGTDIIRLTPYNGLDVFEFRARYFKKFYEKRLTTKSYVTNHTSSLTPAQTVQISSFEITIPIVRFIEYISEKLSNLDSTFINENFYSFKAEETKYNGLSNITDLKKERTDNSRRVYRIVCSDTVTAYFSTLTLLEGGNNE